MSTQPLQISQGALLPMPPDRPIQSDTGYTETPDSLTTTGYTDRPAVGAPQPANVQFPHPSNPDLQGPVVQFPDAATAQQHAASVWDSLKSAVMPSAEFLGNEAKGAGQMVMGLPSAIADSVTVQPTADEQKSLGVPANPSLAEKAALALYRNLGEPIQNAAQWYGTLVRHHQNIIDAIPQDVSRKVSAQAQAQQCSEKFSRPPKRVECPWPGRLSLKSASSWPYANTAKQDYRARSENPLPKANLLQQLRKRTRPHSSVRPHRSQLKNSPTPCLGRPDSSHFEKQWCQTIRSGLAGSTRISSGQSQGIEDRCEQFHRRTQNRVRRDHAGRARAH